MNTDPDHDRRGADNDSDEPDEAAAGTAGRDQKAVNDTEARYGEDESPA